MPSLTRRQFVSRAAWAGTGLALASRGLSAGQAAQPAGSMFVSLNGSLVRGVGGLDKIRMAGKAGYGGVDWDLGPAKTAGLEVTKALFADVNVKPTICGFPMNRQLAFGDAPAFQEALKPLADDAAFVAGVGCEKMMLVLGATSPTPKEEYRKVVVERLAAINEVLQKAKIRLGLEFLGVPQFRAGRAGGPPPIPFIWTLNDTVALSKDAGPNIGAVLDVWHWHHSQGTVGDILAAGSARVVHIHLSDAKQMPPEEVRDNMRLMPGEGIIDLTGFLQALKKIGYTGGISPEPLGRIPAEMSPDEGAKLGLDTTLAAMKKAGVA